MGNCYSCNDGGPRGSEITSDTTKNYFAYQYGDKFEHTLFSYDSQTKRSERVESENAIDVQEKFTIQVLQDVYTLDHDKSQISLTRISDIGSGRPIKTVMKGPPSSRGFPALCVFQNAYIFVSGGQSPIEFTEEFATCDMYDVGKDQWVTVPAMNKARKNHSMCALGKYIYAFSGTSNNGWLDSVERLDASAVIGGRTTRWENVTFEAGNSIPARGVPLLAPWSSDEVIYMGGIVGGVCKGDGYVVNMTTRTVRKVFDSAFNFTGDGNQCVMERMGRIVGVVQDDKNCINLVSYSEGDQILQVIEKIGAESED